VEVSGSATLKVDAKGRIFLPKRYLESDEDDGTRRVLTSLWLTPGLEGCLWLLDQPEWRRVPRRLKLMDVGSQQLRAVQRFFLENTERVKPDSQGRILIPESHRGLASIKSSVQVIGMGRRIEIWAPQEYEQIRATVASQWPKLLEAVLSGEDEEL